MTDARAASPARLPGTEAGPQTGVVAAAHLVTPFDDLAPGLAAMGFHQAAWRGDAVSRGIRGPRLRLVTRGAVGLTHAGTGLCTAMLTEGSGLVAAEPSGVWLTNGAFTDIPFDRISDVYGSTAALAVWTRAADLSRKAVESELACFVHHKASKRFARWFLPLANEGAIHLTQAELARLGGVQRTSACAAMAGLQARGALDVIRGRIVIRDREALRAEACLCRHETSTDDFHGA